LFKIFRVPFLSAASAFVVLALSGLLAPTTAHAQIVGKSCGSDTGWSQTPANSGTNMSCINNVWQFPAYQFGAAWATCNSATGGMVQWTGSALQVCNGTSWTSPPAGAAGSTGDVQFNSSGSLAGSNNLFWNNSSGFLGIGSASPAYALDVNGSVQIANGQNLIFNNASNSGIQLYPGTTINRRASDGSLLLNSGQANIVITPAVNTVFASGSVGIGTTGPTVPLDVFGPGAFQNNAGFPTSGHGIEIVPNVLSGVDAIQSYNRDTSAWRQLRIESSPLVLNDASGANVGINTTSPVGLLSVNLASASGSVGAWDNTYAMFGAAGSTTGAAVGIGYNSSSGYGEIRSVTPSTSWDDLYIRGKNLLFFYQNGSGVTTEGMRIVSSTGNVGINTTSPNTRLNVSGAAGITSFTGGTFLGELIDGATSTNDYSGLDFATHGQGVPTARIGAVITGSGSFLRFGTSNNYSTGITNTAMSIDYNGNVGIGTTAPVSLLSTLGGGAVSPSVTQGAATGEVLFQNAAGTELAFGMMGTAPFTQWIQSRGNVNTAYPLSLNPLGGSVAIGTTTPAANGLTINSVTPTVTFELSGTSEESLYDDGSYFYVISTSGGNGVKLQHGSTLWTSSSDRRIKKDIAALPETYGLNAVERLKPVTFHWRDPKSPQQLQMGLIAQDAQQVIPELVTRSAPTQYAPDGELGIEYSGLVIPLIKAVQELKGDNDNLRREFESYKAAHP